MSYRGYTCRPQFKSKFLVCGPEDSIMSLRGNRSAQKKKLLDSVRKNLFNTRRAKFAGTRPFPKARNFNRAASAEWSKNRTLVASVKSKLSKHVWRTMRDNPVHTDKYEHALEFSHSCPNQGLAYVSSFTKNDVIRLCDILCQSMGNNYGQTYSTPYVVGNPAFGANNYLLGAVTNIGKASYRSADVNLVVKSMYEKQTFQNTCNNTLEFTVHFMKRRDQLPVSFSSDIGASGIDGQYCPSSIQNLLDQIELANGTYNTADNGVPGAVYAEVPSRYGTNILSYSGVKQYYKCVKKMQFKVKPGEQHEISLRLSGPHRLNLPQLHQFASFKHEIEIVIVCRASQISANNATTVSHGSGQYSLIRNYAFKGVFGGIAITPTKRVVNAPLVAIANVNQFAINPETDDAQAFAQVA